MRLGVPRVDIAHAAVRDIDPAHEQGHETAAVRTAVQHGIQPLHQLQWPRTTVVQHACAGERARHEQCSAHALARDVAEQHDHLAVGAMMEVVQVATDLVAALEPGVTAPPRHRGQRRQQRALDAHRGRDLLLEAQPRLFGLEQSRVRDLDRGHVAKQREQFEFALAEDDARIGAVGVKDAEHGLVVEQRHRHGGVDRLRDDAVLAKEARVLTRVAGQDGRVLAQHRAHDGLR